MANKQFIISRLEAYHYDPIYNTLDEAFQEAKKVAFKCREDYGVYKLVTSACLNQDKVDEAVTRVDA